MSTNSIEVEIDKIKLMRAHAKATLELADGLTLNFLQAGVFAPASRKKEILTDDQKAKFLARKNKNKY